MTARRRVALAGAVALFGLGLFLVALTALRSPMSGGDYVAIWGLKARALYRGDSLDALFRVDPAGAFSHPEYPPLWPLVLAGVSRLLGRYDELLLGALWPVLCAAAALRTAAATRAPPELAWVAAAALTLLPYYRTPLYVGYAEALLVALVLEALSWCGREGRRPALVAAALFTLAALTKQEGALAGLVAAGTLLGRKRPRAAAAVAGGVLLAGVVPWQLFVALRAPRPPARDFALAAFDPGQLAPAALVLLREALLSNLPWILGGALLLALAPTVRRERRGLLLFAGVYAGILFLSFAFSTRDPAWHLRWTWDRLALVPVAALLPVLVEAAWEAMREEPAGA